MTEQELTALEEWANYTQKYSNISRGTLVLLEAFKSLTASLAEVEKAKNYHVERADALGRLATERLETLTEVEAERDANVLNTVNVPDGDGGWTLAAKFYDYGYFDRVQAAIERESTPREPVACPQWQPIETAPKDGAPVRLKWAATTVEATGYWNRGGNLRYAGPSWRDVEGNDTLTAPTHWQPIPLQVPS